MNLIARNLGMNTEPIIFDYPKGSPRFDFRDSLNGIRNGSIDTIGIATQDTEKHLLEFSFSNTLYEFKSGILVHQSENVYNDFWSFLTVFDPFVWIAILAVLLIQFGLCAVIRKVETVVYKADSISIIEVCKISIF
jgi:hypothetical protein